MFALPPTPVSLCDSLLPDLTRSEKVLAKALIEVGVLRARVDSEIKQ